MIVSVRPSRLLKLENQNIYTNFFQYRLFMMTLALLKDIDNLTGEFKVTHEFLSKKLLKLF